MTTAILAGLMGATVAGISVVGAANLVVLDGKTLKVVTIRGNIIPMNPVNVTKGVIDGTTEAGQGNIVSAGKTVGENLTALDTAVATNKNDIVDEATARTDADTKLDTRITNVKEYLEKQTAADYVSKTDAAVQDGAVVKADKTIGENVTNLDGALAKETAARIGADAAQDKVIQQVNDNLVSSVDTINKNIGTITDQLNKNDLAEAQTRAAADKTLQGNIDAEATARESGDNALQNQIKKESAARQADVSRLDNKIHDVSKEVDTVGALSMAMSGLHPLSYDEGDARFQLSAAVGTYDGTEALALGGFYHFNRDSMLSVGVATDLGADEHRMGANVGYTRRIGQGGHVSRPSEGTVSDIMKDIKNLEQKQAKLEQENEQLKQQLAALKK